MAERNGVCGFPRGERLREDTLMFFDGHRDIYPLYEAFEDRVLRLYPQTGIRVQKTQIAFYNRHMFACVSFLRPGRKAELPESYFVLTLGLPYPLESERVAVKTEPYPGRWTTHIVLSAPEELDGELFDWVEQAYAFAQSKR